MQTEKIMDDLVSLGLYVAVPGATGGATRYHEDSRLVETTRRLKSDARPGELNDVLDAWALEDAEDGVDADRFADEAGQ